MDILKQSINQALQKSTGDTDDEVVKGRATALGNEIGQAVYEFHNRHREVPLAKEGNEGDVITVENGIYVLKPVQVETSLQTSIQPIKSAGTEGNFTEVTVTGVLTTSQVDTRDTNTEVLQIKDRQLSYNMDYSTIQIGEDIILGNTVHTFGHGPVNSQGEYRLLNNSSPLIISPYTGYVDKITIGYNLRSLMKAPRSFVLTLDIDGKEYTIYEMTETNDPDDFTETLVIESLEGTAYPIDYLAPMSVKLVQNGYEITDLSVSLLARITS